MRTSLPQSRRPSCDAVNLPVTTVNARPRKPPLTNGGYPATQSVLTSALLDRLLHHAETVLIEGKSYRSKDQVEV